MIYTRFYTPVNLTAAEMKHEQVKAGHQKGIWFTAYYVKAEQSEPHPHDGSGHAGRPILDGQWFNASELKADEGWSEIMDRVHELLPEVEDA